MLLKEISSNDELKWPMLKSRLMAHDTLDTDITIHSEYMQTIITEEHGFVSNSITNKILSGSEKVII